MRSHWLPLFYLCFGIQFLLVSGRQSEAHWWGTHEMIINQAIPILKNDGKSVELLQKYVYHLYEGVRDADLRTNGVHGIDCGCTNPEEDTTLGDSLECPTSRKVFRDIGDITPFVFGDHTYDPTKGAGVMSAEFYFSDPENERRIKERLENYRIEPEAANLYHKLAGNTVDEKIESLNAEIDRSNAAVLADLFYNRANNSWNLFYQIEQEQHAIDAMYNLGIALHMVQDVTVPEHVRPDKGENYERFVWKTYLREGEKKDIPEIKVDFSNLSAGDLVKKTAMTTYRWGESALDPKISAEDSFVLGVQITANMLTNFLKNEIPNLGMFGASVDILDFGIYEARKKR